jgi:hypothetical protein
VVFIGLTIVIDEEYVGAGVGEGEGEGLGEGEGEGVGVAAFQFAPTFQLDPVFQLAAKTVGTKVATKINNRNAVMNLLLCWVIG